MSTSDMNSVLSNLLLGGSQGLMDLAKQAAKLDRQVAETEIKHEGNAITLPADPEKMSIDTAMTLLAARKKAADQEYDINESIEGYPLDAAAAFYRAVQKRYGFVNSVTVEKTSFFGMKYDHRPDMRQIRTGPKPGDLIQVPVGAFQLPGFDKPIETKLYVDRRTGKMDFLVTGTLKAKDRDAIREILAEARQELAENSIYKGKALVLRTDSDGDVTLDNEPEFMETDRINPANLVLSRGVEELLQQTLFTIIQKTERCRKLKIPLKRTITLAGPYGTGKTLIASVTARHCVEHGWTYVMVDRVEGLAGALKFARRYAPALVFAEDIDRAAGERDDETNDLLNEIDGILAKDSEVMTVLTTNHLDRIIKAQLRPGRTDAIIHVDAPDAEAAERLVRLCAGKLLRKEATLTALGIEIKGYIPAVIREIVERSKLGMIGRDATTLSEEDLLVAARSMKAHAELISEKVAADEPNTYEKLGRAFSEVMSNGALSGVNEKLDTIHKCVD